MVKWVELECLGEAVDAALDGAIEDVVADLDAETAEEFGGDFVGEGQVLAVLGDDEVGSAAAFFEIESGGAFDRDLLALHFQTNQSF